MAMKPNESYTRRWGRLSRTSIAMLCAAIIVTGSPPCHAQSSDSDADSDGSAARIPAEQLDSLVAPIALYPDPLLAQVLAASTYPLEIVQLQQWLEKNKGLKDQALVNAVEKQPWDSSVQAMAPLPDLVKRLADDVQWTTDLGNAFLAQQSDVMDAVQRMRQKAQAKGNLQTTEQMKVETKVIENKSVIVVEPASPEVVYVPSYNPTVVYGAPPPAYPYPPVYYPPVGYYAAGMAITFGLGVAMGAAWGGGWGNCGWGSNNDININNSNNFNSNRNVNRGGNRGGSGNWQHNPQHRGGAPYGDRATASKFGGNARGDSLSKRQAGARQQVGRQGGNLASSRDAGRAGGRAGGPSQGPGGGRAGGGPSQGPGGGRAGGGPSQGPGGGRAGGGPSQGPGGGRAGGPSQGPGGRGASGPDRVGSRDMSHGAGGRSDGFGGGRGGYSGSSARAASNRGASSMGSRGGGGGFGGGGRGGGGGGRGGGGGGRGGGGRRR
jgi:hypothetical protein